MDSEKFNMKHPNEGWIEARECWRRSCLGIPRRLLTFTEVMNFWSGWWMNCAANKDGWNTKKIKAKRAWE